MSDQKFLTKALLQASRPDYVSISKLCPEAQVAAVQMQGQAVESICSAIVAVDANQSSLQRDKIFGRKSARARKFSFGQKLFLLGSIIGLLASLAANYCLHRDFVYGVVSIKEFDPMCGIVLLGISLLLAVMIFVAVFRFKIRASVAGTGIEIDPMALSQPQPSPTPEPKPEKKEPAGANAFVGRKQGENNERKLIVLGR